jgi:peptidoglycan/LPS O-acetylase OafA/YrhL
LDWRFSRAFLPNKAMYFALGVASAALVDDARARWRFLAVLGAVLALCLAHGNSLTALASLAWVLCLAAQWAHGLSGLGRARLGRAGLGRLGLGWLGLRALGGLLGSAPLCWLGSISYSVYLVNEPIQKLLGVALTEAVGGRAMLFTLIWIPAAVLLPVSAAWWLHYWIEMPALRRGRVLAAAA